MAAPTERTLRITTIFSSIPASVLLLVSALIGESLVCFLCLIPLVTSFVVSLIYVQKTQKQSRIALPTTSTDGHDSLKDSGPAWPFVDVSISLLYLGMLIAFWATLGNIWDRDIVVVSTYGTVSMLLNCFIHFYLFLGHFKWSNECPHCGGSFPVGRPSLAPRETIGYSALGEHRDTAVEQNPVVQKTPLPAEV
ncbi:hypothetical protein BDV96DRAFT_694034 [Lophiotrema nucula]|uniref:Uncharacterized protein n=1 Tax=Lophiotrema nucula TaxID=690887 RepID=A0A6A5YHT5_9PLEO|nr:hypothetical protein BDV96DRAFT_694034 [Lophiotrema nucula]